QLSQPASQAANPLEAASRAPGSERLAPDEHPELAHLTHVSTDSLAEAITAYVAAESKQRGGSFPVPAPGGGQELGLTLHTVHRERLSRLADGRYFACADFKDTKGNTYDGSGGVVHVTKDRCECRAPESLSLVHVFADLGRGDQGLGYPIPGMSRRVD